MIWRRAKALKKNTVARSTNGMAAGKSPFKFPSSYSFTRPASAISVWEKKLKKSLSAEKKDGAIYPVTNWPLILCAHFFGYQGPAGYIGF